jgi:DNA-binding transcriptional MocR family regulator
MTLVTQVDPNNSDAPDQELWKVLDLICAAIGDRSARGIAAAVSRLVTSGQLSGGARLPTVRSVAQRLGISPTTVSEAWGSLTKAGVIQTRGRSGTFVLHSERPRQRLRYSQLTSSPATLPYDLSTGIPDHELLPDLSQALRRIGDEPPALRSYLDHPVLPRLEELLRERWPYPPEQLTIVDGALDALDRITGALVRFGDHVAVENPAFPPTLDLLESVGAIAVPVALDEAGPRPDSLAAALEHRAVAFYLQPRAHNPTGISMSLRRARELSEILSKSDTVVVEDDHAGEIATAPPVSLGRHLPGRTLRIHSFSKSHGPDLRLAAIGGPANVLAAITDRRLLGPGWSSRLLQAVLVDLLTDLASVAQVRRARAAYRERRLALLEALTVQGIEATADDGINLWMTVASQEAAVLSLAAHGIAVAPGTPFEVAPLGADHVRVTVGLVHHDFEHLAEVLAAAARPQPKPGGARHRALPRNGR